MNPARRRLGLGLLLLAVLATITITSSDKFLLTLLGEANVLAIAALAFDIYSGTTHYINLGFAFTLGLGGFGFAHLASLGVPPALAIPLGALLAMSLSLILLLPSLRVRGIYFSILSLMYPLVLSQVGRYGPLIPLFGGEAGLPAPSFLGDWALKMGYLGVLRANGLVSLAVLAATFVALARVWRSRWGIAFRAIGQDEGLAEACGVDTKLAKAYSFLLSSFFAGLAGALSASMYRFVGLQVFDPATWLLSVLTVTVIGGLGTLVGPLLMSYLFVFLSVALLRTYLGVLSELAFTLLLVLFIVVRPRGLLFDLYARAIRWLKL